MERRIERLEKIILSSSCKTSNAAILSRLNRIKGLIQEPAIQSIHGKLSGLLKDNDLSSSETSTVDKIELQCMLDEILVVGPGYADKAAGLLKELKEFSDTTKFDFMFDGNKLIFQMDNFNSIGRITFECFYLV